MMPPPIHPPPRISRALIRLAVGPLARDEVDSDLKAIFRSRVQASGARRARAWYRRQALGFVLRSPRLRASSSPRPVLAGIVGRGPVSVGSGLGLDLKAVVRGLARSPSFTGVAIATLALGIGANAAILSLATANLVAPLPYDHPRELVLLWETEPGTAEETTVSPANFLSWTEESRAISAMAAYNVDFATLTGEGDPERLSASVVQPGFFGVLGVTPRLGRVFDVGATDQVILSHGLWARRFGSDPTVVGRTIQLDGSSHEVVGVMAESFRQPEHNVSWQRAALWRPLPVADFSEGSWGRYLRVLGRLAPDATLEEARTEMTAIGQRLAAAYPEENAGVGVLVNSLTVELVGDARSAILLLLVGGALVLVVVSANLASLHLARGLNRTREFAVRAALGGGRLRTVRLVLLEAVLLTAGGALLGSLLAFAASGWIAAAQERYVNAIAVPAVDLRVLALTGALALATALSVGLPAAQRAARPDLRLDLSGARGGPGAGRGMPARHALVIGQVALATALVIGAALLSRSLVALTGVPTGFDSGGVLTFSVGLPPERYDSAGVALFQRELRRQLAELPSVTAASYVSDLPFTSENRWADVYLDEAAEDAALRRRAEFRTVGPGYFETMGIPTFGGVGLGDVYDGDGEGRVVVNRAMAEMLWPGSDALGQRFFTNRDTPRRVVGIVGDVLDDGFAGLPEPIYYRAIGQSPQRRVSFIVRSSGEAGDMLPAVRRLVVARDGLLPVTDARTLEGLLAETVSRPRAASLAGLSLALVALLVAAAGVYGLLAYTVAARTREIGVRVALGADTRRVVAMVVGQSLRLIAMGLALGVILALLGGRLLSGFLYGVASWDPVSIIGAALTLLLVALGAATLPARRAASVDPNQALRAEG